MDIQALHQDLWNRLQARRAQLPHALLLSGQRGIGKFALAQAFAAGVLCEKPHADGSACGACLACGWLSQGNHPDFRLLQPEALAEGEGDDGGDAGEGKKKASQQITIEQVRGLDDFLHVGTHRQGLRIILIHPAEAMNRNTANALLKSLEEPAPGSLFLLVSSESDRLLPTIRSRCQSVAVPIPDPALATAWLAAAGVKDGGAWLALAGGAPCLAVELADRGERVLLDALLQALRQGGGLDALAAATSLDKVVKAEKGATPLKRLVEWLQKWHHDLARLNGGLPLRYFVGEQAALTSLAQSADKRGLFAFNKELNRFKVESQTSVNSRLFLESLLQAYAALFQPTGKMHG